jgi:hypothetical protein
MLEAPGPLAHARAGSERRRDMGLRLSAAWVLVLALSSCRTAPVPAIEQQGLRADATPTLEEAEQRIRTGAATRGWNISKESPGLLIGTLRVRTHALVVEIPYDETHFGIRYRSSENLLDSGKGKVHRKAFAWMNRLAQAISEEP